MNIWRLCGVVVVAGALAGTIGTGHAEETNDDLFAGWLAQLRHEAATIAAEMDQPRTLVSYGPMLRAGSAGPRVAELAQRLHELELLDDAGLEASGGVFTEEVEEAVEAYQAQLGLFVDGVVGPQTLNALNRSREDALRAIAWTIREVEELREEAPPVFLQVNVPSMEALLIRDGSVARRMHAAVGRGDRQTPIMEDRVVEVVLNPVWSVPPTIMREDVLPRLRSSGAPGVSQSRVYLDGQEVDPGVVDWSEVDPSRIYITQRPGGHNALGRYLFYLTNNQGIFLHDTNTPGVFSRAHRGVSSGCVRLEQAAELATLLLRPQGLDAEDIQRRVAQGGTQRFPLDEPLPVFITYWTATVVPDVGIVIHDDIYYRMNGFSAELPTDGNAVSG